MPEPVMVLIIVAGVVMMLAVAGMLAAIIYLMRVASRAQAKASQSIARLQEMTDRLEAILKGQGDK